MFVFFKQKTAYDVRISDWSSDVCSSDLKLFIKTYGCQMNVYDSARMADVLTPLGYAPTPTPDDADMVILNTCHIREKASEKVYSDSEERRVGKERGSTCRSRWSPDH